MNRPPAVVSARVPARWLVVLAALATAGLTACGSDDGDGALAATPDATTELDAAPGPEVGGPYRRVVPGYATEAACRELNPDFGFGCIELVSLCPAGELRWLFTDIVFGGTWSESGGMVEADVENFGEGEGSFVFEVRPDGSLYSPEVYGDRAFDRSTVETDDLCR